MGRADSRCLPGASKIVFTLTRWVTILGSCFFDTKKSKKGG